MGSNVVMIVQRLQSVLAALCLTVVIVPPAIADVREDLERALAHALQQADRDLLTEQNTLPETGAATEPALVFLLKKGCVKVRERRDAATGTVTNEWSLGDGCGQECRIGRLTSPWLRGDGLICRVARQTDIRVTSYTPPASDSKGAWRTRLQYMAKLVDVADWAQDPEYVAIWRSYGLNFKTFQAPADMVKTAHGWVPYD
jgi:hypothetical protein